MRLRCVSACLVSVALFATSAACGLEIRVAPQALVLSSNGGQLTVHTDLPIEAVEGAVELTVNGTEVPCGTFADNLGNLVAQCTKEAAKGAIGDFPGKTTTVIVALSVLGETASEDIRVKK